MTAKGLSDNLKERQPVPRRRRRRALGRVRVLVRVVLGLARTPPRRDEEASLDASRPRCGPRVGGQACGPPVDHRRRALGALRRLVHGVEARLHGRGRRGCSQAARHNYADSLYADANTTLDDLREAVTTLEDAGRIARRVLGGAHPITTGIESSLRESRAELRARDTSGS